QSIVAFPSGTKISQAVSQLLAVFTAIRLKGPGSDATFSQFVAFDKTVRSRDRRRSAGWHTAGLTDAVDAIGGGRSSLCSAICPRSGLAVWLLPYPERDVVR